MDQKNLSRFALIAAALLFSTGGAAIKACDLTSWQVASFRSGIAALTIILFLPRARKGWSWKAALVGLVYSLTMICFVVANKLTTSANTIFLQDSAPLYLLLLGPLLLHEHIKRRDVFLMAAVAGGMTLFFIGAQDPSETAPDPFTGNILAAVSGLTWALTLVGLRWLGKSTGGRNSTGAAVVIGNLIAFGACLPLALPLESGMTGPADWLILIYLGAFQIGVAYMFLTSAAPHVPVFETSIILLLEPALNPVWSWMVHGENPGLLAICGGSIILSATMANTYLATRRKRMLAEQKIQ